MRLFHIIARTDRTDLLLTQQPQRIGKSLMTCVEDVVIGTRHDVKACILKTTAILFVGHHAPTRTGRIVRAVRKRAFAIPEQYVDLPQKRRAVTKRVYGIRAIDEHIPDRAECPCRHTSSSAILHQAINEAFRP